MLLLDSTKPIAGDTATTISLTPNSDLKYFL